MNSRRFDLDWLRVIAIAMVFVFHTTRFFDPAYWHVKNLTTYEPLALWISFFVLWGMPFMFVISGASIFFALKHSALRFVDDKVRRLLIPFVAGVLLQIPIDVYLERITHRQFAGSFFDFLPHYFDGWYGYTGNFAWNGLHLWYLEILFILSVLLYPLLRWLKDGSGKTILKALGDILARPGLVYLVFLPIWLLLIAVDPRSPLGQPNFGGWSPVPYIVFFLAGFLVMSHEEMQKRIRENRWLSLGIALVVTVGLVTFYIISGTPTFGTLAYDLFYLVYAFLSWCWIQTVLGFGFEYLNKPRPILAYIGPAVLPFYILHQTVLLVIGYFVVQWPIPDLLKWALIFVVSFVAIMLLYEIIRRVNILRFLFGMKWLPRAAVPRSEPTRPAPAN